jgi:hypothetical protein
MLVSSAVVVLAGNLDPPSAPTDAASQMVTLEQVYQRLDAGAAGTKMTSFTEPASGPGTGTMHTLDDIMASAPTVDNTAGALAAEVLAGKTFWSLRTNSAWGTQTGTMPNNGAITYTPGTNDQPVAAGYHNGSGEVEGDADLQAGNIRSGITIFGVTGTYPPAPVPKTGQVGCYLSTGVDASCTCGDENCPRRQDGDLQKGVTWPTPRFTIHDNGTPADTSDDTVTDNLTGLMWMRNGDAGDDCAGADTGIESWADAMDSVAACNEASGFAGYKDWRLPNRRELFSLIHHGEPSVATWLNNQAFTNVKALIYWTSTTVQNDMGDAWYVHLSRGVTSYQGKLLSAHVWPVRGGP